MFDGGILVNVMGQLKTDEVKAGMTSLLYSAILMIICPNIMSEPWTETRRTEQRNLTYRSAIKINSHAHELKCRILRSPSCRTLCWSHRPTPSSSSTTSSVLFFTMLLLIKNWTTTKNQDQSIIYARYPDLKSTTRSLTSCCLGPFIPFRSLFSLAQMPCTCSTNQNVISPTLLNQF